MTKKHEGRAARTATWVTNVGNEHGQGRGAVMERLVQEVLDSFAGLTDTMGLPLIDEARMAQIWITQRHHLICIQETPGVQLYTQTGEGLSLPAAAATAAPEGMEEDEVRGPDGLSGYQHVVRLAHALVDLRHMAFITQRLDGGSHFFELCRTHCEGRTIAGVRVNRWGAIRRHYCCIRDNVYNSSSLMAVTPIQLFEVNQRTLLLWHNERSAAMTADTVSIAVTVLGTADALFIGPTHSDQPLAIHHHMDSSEPSDAELIASIKTY
ncbi:unnamed protein product [Lota lota]